MHDTLPDVATTGDGVKTDYSRSGEVLTINFASAHGITTGDIVNIDVTAGGTVDPNGNHSCTASSSTQIQITITGLDAEPTGAMNVKGPKLDTSASNFIHAACEFSDPNNEAASYIAAVGTQSTILVKTSDSGATTVTLTYPSGESVPEGSNIIQAFNKLFIFRKGQIALQWDGDVSTTTFSLVSNGTFTQPTPIPISDLDFASGTATATVSSTSSLLVGDVLTITTAGTSGYTVGDTVTVSEVTNSTTFKFPTDKADDTNKTATVSKPISIGLGFTHMPAPEFGIYHQRRLVVPYRYDITGSSGSATITDKKILDEALFFGYTRP